MRMQGFKPKELLRIFHDHGWQEVKSKGSHIKFIHPDHDKVISIPLGHKKELSRPLVQRLLKEAKIII